MASRSTTAAAVAFDQVVGFLGSFADLEDPRQRAKVMYPLDEVLLCVFGVLAGCESWVEVEIARSSENKLAFLYRFRPFEEGTPSHDQLGDVFVVLDAEQLQRCFTPGKAHSPGSARGSSRLPASRSGAPTRRPGRRLPST